jgi:hypothetical protein
VVGRRPGRQRVVARDDDALPRHFGRRQLAAQPGELRRREAAVPGLRAGDGRDGVGGQPRGGLGVVRGVLGRLRVGCGSVVGRVWVGCGLVMASWLGLVDRIVLEFVLELVPQNANAAAVSAIPPLAASPKRPSRPPNRTSSCPKRLTSVVSITTSRHPGPSPTE